MKTKKMNLSDLKVESFVTSLESKDAQTVKGGSTIACGVAAAEAFQIAAVVIVVGAAVAGVAVGAAVAVGVIETTKKK